TCVLATIGASGLLLSAAAQPASLSNPNFAPASKRISASPVEGQRAVSPAIMREGRTLEAAASVFMPRSRSAGADSNDLTMKFINAPLKQVLSYLSDAAGFIIVQDSRANLNGYVTIQGSHITQDEAVNLLNTQLNQNNLAAVRDQRTLTIVNKSDALTSRIPVRMGSDPAGIPDNDEIATWIIPIRFVDSRQLASDLSLFVAPQARVVANDAGNSIIITDTQANIRHLAEIIQYVDGSAQAETVVKVFPLKYANPNDVASELAGVFPGADSSGNTAPISFGGPGGGRGGPGGGFGQFAGNAGADTSSSEQRIQKAREVSAVADGRTQSVIVTAPSDLMTQIAGIIQNLDVRSDHDQFVQTIQLRNSDPQQIAQLLQSMFGGSSSSSSSTGSSSTSALEQRRQNGISTMGQTTTSGSLGGGSLGGSGATGGGRGGTGL
ncbi:MAG TPA: secretin N-terminal domain-containing protein, partial [Verrucomicrobiae bacterium]|nr:secretin N-terminal domain-containing protein [Verrucomicrobiae bacterium]